MGRAKLNLELIQKEKTRNSTFQKRKICLKKKLHELSTLCGVKAMMIIYGPKETPMQDQPIQPEIWPEDRVEVLELIKKYKDQSPEDRKKRTSLVYDFFVERNKKAQAELTKLRKSNAQAKYPTWDQRFDNLSEEKLREIANFLENKLGYAKALKTMKENNSNHHAYQQQMQQQHSMLSKKRSMPFEGSDQAYKRCLYTTALRESIETSYDPQFPAAMQIPIPISVQHHRHTLGNDYVCGPSNIVYATPLAKLEPNMVYDDPMTSRIVPGMSESISHMNSLIRAPSMYYYGDTIQPMFQNYIEEVMQPMPQSYMDSAMQPMPQNYIEYPIIRARAASSQMLATASSQMLAAASYQKIAHDD